MTEHKLQNYEVHAIERKDASSLIDEGKAVFVIGVPDSPNAPFQNARDNKYYMRIGGNSEPASHRIVMDIMGRSQHPRIELQFALVVRKETNKEFDFDIGPRTVTKTLTVCELIINATNVGRVLAQYVNADIKVPIDMFAQDEVQYDRKIKQGDQMYGLCQFDNTKRDVLDVTMALYKTVEKYGPSWFNPILPGRTHQWTIQLRSDWGDFHQSPFFSRTIEWTTHADNGAPVTGTVLTEEIRLIDRRKRSTN